MLANGLASANLGGYQVDLAGEGIRLTQLPSEEAKQLPLPALYQPQSRPCDLSGKKGRANTPPAPVVFTRQTPRSLWVMMLPVLGEDGFTPIRAVDHLSG
jgi:hypothetical protein